MTLFYPIANVTAKNLDLERTFNLLSSPENPDLNISLSETQVARLQMANAPWMVGIRWLYKKKYNPNYQILGRKKHEKLYAQLCEPFGDWLLSILNLCSELSLIDNLLTNSLSESPYLHSREYKNPIVRFNAICLEIKKQDYLESLSLVPVANKKEAVGDIRQILKTLREWRNPFARREEPHVWKLVQDCLLVANLREPESKRDFYPEFVREFWNGKDTKHPSFLVAYAQLAASLEKPYFQQAMIEADERTRDGQKIKVKSNKARKRENSERRKSGRGGDEIFLSNFV